ncbi:hypothetical protein CTAYLR_003251 [Chrysophaeum taylorii]|uniref:Alpha/beta hydrolase fold-3 domain-containing protein n=1 Tax=Chrysophaeum taylorii TaxID=2483200 RepID=A0AAD7XK89_9STRA|nr:hypothetical protein CTAYLR_003251 [Chrysophaeum taylorii]
MGKTFSMLWEADPDVTFGDVIVGWLAPLVISFKRSYDEKSLAKLRSETKSLSKYNPAAWAVKKVEVSSVVVYIHSPLEGDAPKVVCWIHGGGFTVGEAEDGAGHELFVELNKRGRVAWASIEYRLAPEHPYPAAIDDAVVAMRWLQTQYANVSLAGISAGANIALATALALDESPPSLALLYPFLDPNMDSASYAKHGDRMNFAAYLAWCWDVYKAGDALLQRPRADFERALGATRVLVSTSRGDPLRDEGLSLVRLLEASGVPDVVHVEGRGSHGLGHTVDPALRERLFEAWTALIDLINND